MAPDPEAGEVARRLWGRASCDPYPVMLMAVVKGSYADKLVIHQQMRVYARQSPPPLCLGRVRLV